MFVSVYEPRSPSPHGTMSPWHSVTFLWSLLPVGLLHTIVPRNNRRTGELLVTAKSRWRPEVKCSNVEALAGELWKYEARNLPRDRLLADSVLDLEVEPFYFENRGMPPHVPQSGYALMLKSVRVTLDCG